MIVPQVTTKNYAPTLYDLERAGFDVFAEPFGSWWDTFVPTHKEELIKKFMHTYYFHQIEGETPDRFRVYVNSQLERIMPYYNKLYQSELIKFNPMLTHSLITRERSVENLVRLANTDKSSVGKALRDFINSSRVTTSAKQTSNENTTSNDTIHTSTKLDTTGQESKVENSEEQEGTKYHGTNTTTSEAIQHEQDGGKNTETMTETPGKIITTDYGKNTNKNGSGKTDTKETENISKSGHTAFSDTPQKLIVDDDLKVRMDYLSTYTQTGDTESRTDNTGVTNTYSDTEELGGSDTVKESGTTLRVTDTELGTTKDINTNKTVKGEEDSQTDRTLIGKIKSDKDYSENKTGDDWTTKEGKIVDVADTTSEQTAEEFQKNSETGTTAKAEEEAKREHTSEDKGGTTIVEGFSGTIAAELLKAFRETFLNIDDMIIRDLRENFMEVF